MCTIKSFTVPIVLCHVYYYNLIFETGLITQVKLFCIRVQTKSEKEGTEIPPKNVTVIEKCIEPEKVFSDSFITEDIDGRKVNITRKVSSRKVKRITYSDLVIFITKKN